MSTSDLGGCLVVILLGIGLALAMALVMAIPVFFLWNWLIPSIFGLKTISLFEAWGLAFLCGLLFKSGASSSSSSKQGA